RVMDHQVRSSKGLSPVRAEERLEIRGVSCLGAPDPGAFVAFRARHRAPTIRAPRPARSMRQVRARDPERSARRAGPLLARSAYFRQPEGGGTMNRRLLTLTIALAAAAALAAPAVGDGPPPGISQDGQGITSPDGKLRYLALTSGRDTIVEALNTG